jgi:hypothetical protein
MSVVRLHLISVTSRLIAVRLGLTEVRLNVTAVRLALIGVGLAEARVTGALTALILSRPAVMFIRAAVRL